MSDMNNDESITFSFTFRCVEKTVEVKKDGSLAKPQKFTNKSKDAKFEKGAKLMTGDEYLKKISEIDNRVVDFLNNFKP
jgi:hypothetical protein